MEQMLEPDIALIVLRRTRRHDWQIYGRARPDDMFNMFRLFWANYRSAMADPDWAPTFEIKVVYFAPEPTETRYGTRYLVPHKFKSNHQF